MFGITFDNVFDESTAFVNTSMKVPFSDRSWNIAPMGMSEIEMKLMPYPIDEVQGGNTYEPYVVGSSTDRFTHKMTCNRENNANESRRKRKFSAMSGMSRARNTFPSRWTWDTAGSYSYCSRDDELEHVFPVRIGNLIRGEHLPHVSYESVDT